MQPGGQGRRVAPVSIPNVAANLLHSLLMDKEQPRMLSVRCTGPIARREFLHVGALALSSLSLSDVFAGRAAAGEANRDTSVILLYLHGGPSQLETYDL